MNLTGLAIKIFGPIVDKYEKYFFLLKESLPKANIRMPFKAYLSIAMMLTFIITSLSFALTYMFFYILGRPFLICFSYAFLTSMVISIMEFTFIFYYPIQIANRRSRNIEANLPFVISHMGALAESGIPPYVMFKLISQFEEYGEVSKEMGKIVRNIETFGLDPITAIREVAERTPSDSLKQLLMGFITTTESGGSIKLYLKEVGKQTMFEWRTKREKFIRFLDTFSELYTGVVIAAPLLLISLFAVMGMIEPNIGGWSIMELTKIGTYGLIPLINLGFLAFLHGIEVEM